jgi:hypothetical protein
LGRNYVCHLGCGCHHLDAKGSWSGLLSKVEQHQQTSDNAGMFFITEMHRVWRPPLFSPRLDTVYGLETRSVNGKDDALHPHKLAKAMIIRTIIPV